VHWNEEKGRAWRKKVALTQETGGKLTTFDFRGATPGPTFLGADGLLNAYQLPQPGTQAWENFQQGVAIPFAVFHHMPPAPEIPTPDWDTALDFHQALSALNAYRELQRALGLVFDLELPPDFVALSGFVQPKTLGVVAFQPGWDWEIKPEPHHTLRTAYYHLASAETRLFLAALNPQGLQPGGVQVLGLLNLAPNRFGLAQVDVDGGMHKNIILAEAGINQAPSPHPEVFDPAATLPALRSGGLSLFADQRALGMLNMLGESKNFNTALEGSSNQPRPFYAEDLVRGYRLDIWDGRSGQWHSLHRRDGLYQFEDQTFKTQDEEGFVQLAVTQAAPDPERVTPADELYLHEAIARWAGWSLSAPVPGKHLTRHADPEKAVPPDPGDPDYDPENPPVTPFKMAPQYRICARLVAQAAFW